MLGLAIPLLSTAGATADVVRFATPSAVVITVGRLDDDEPMVAATAVSSSQIEISGKNDLHGTSEL